MWKKTNIELPEDGVVVETKIEDESGTRNLSKLILKNGLWFFDDMSMYVYYTPTHWRAL